VERVPAFGAGSEVGIDPNLSEHDILIVPVFVIVGKIDISVFEQAVGNQEIMRFISGEGLAGRGEQNGPCIVKNKRGEE
jgi:hypothetical protein